MLSRRPSGCDLEGHARYVSTWLLFDRSQLVSRYFVACDHEVSFLSKYSMLSAEYLAILESRNDAGDELRRYLARAEAGGVSSVGLG